MPDDSVERQRTTPEGASRKNHPGSRYGTAPEERPDLDPEIEPAVVADVKPSDVPLSFPGALPENAGRDPADTHRDKEDGRRRR